MPVHVPPSEDTPCPCSPGLACLAMPCLAHTSHARPTAPRHVSVGLAPPRLPCLRLANPHCAIPLPSWSLRSGRCPSIPQIAAPSQACLALPRLTPMRQCLPVPDMPLRAAPRILLALPRLARQVSPLLVRPILASPGIAMPLRSSPGHACFSPGLGLPIPDVPCLPCQDAPERFAAKTRPTLPCLPCHVLSAIRGNA
jgi:hypothetical protein